MVNLFDGPLLLLDDRAGNRSQVLGLGCELGKNCKEKEAKTIDISYNFFARLPNCLIQDSLIGISEFTKRQIKNIDFIPKFIISAGRKSAPVALHLKKKFGSKTIIIQIMNPNLDFGKFDHIILPKHDLLKIEKYPNVITTTGALVKLTKEDLHNSLSYKTDKTKIAFLVGGSTKKVKLDVAVAKKLARQVAKIANNMNAVLFVLDSRRTGIDVSNTIKNSLNCDFEFFNYDQNPNPYISVVASADFFIITGDSVSMISECAFTGKPIYIADDLPTLQEKHRRFHQSLYEGNYAKKLMDDTNHLVDYSPQKLQETRRVANLICQKV